MAGSARFLGGIGGKIGLNVEKYSFSQGLSREFFQVVPDTYEHTILHVFRPNLLPSELKKHQKSKKTVFLDKFQTVRSFLPSP